jgi:hypothetical protein
MLQAWLINLEEGFLKANGTRAPVCQFDLDNLTWSSRAIRNSITVRLWEEIEPELEFGATGPQIFVKVMRRIQHSSASASRALLQKLQEMKLNKEPGMNVDNFTLKITETLRRIEGNDPESIPKDLSVIVAMCFLDTDVDEFKLEASTIFNIVDVNPNAMKWRTIVSKMKTKYRSLEGIGRWPHKGRKSATDDLAALQGSLNALSQKFDGLQKGGGSNNQGQKDHSEILCYNCNKKGHMSRNCPAKGGNQGNSGGGGASQGESWTRQKPGAEESHTKKVDSVEHIWCDCCGRWRKDQNRHVTANHKTRAELAAQAGTTPPSGVAPPAPAGAGNVGGLQMMGGLFCGGIIPGNRENPREDPVVPLNWKAGRQ